MKHVRGLEAFWACQTRRAPYAPISRSERVMLDALGLSIGQTTAFLGLAPDWEAFAAWIAERVGVPDPDAIARYHAWLDGAPVPLATQSQLDAVEAMEDALSSAELSHWDREGYVILRGAVTPREAADAAAFLYDRVGGIRDDPDSWYDHAAGSIMVEQFQHPSQDAIRRSPRIHKAFAQLWGTADLWVQVDRMSFNPPVRPAAPGVRASPGTGPRLHWDVSLATPIPMGIQGILYLTDTTADQGALELVPGFHRRIEGWLSSIGDAAPRDVDLSAQAMTIAANAGDLILWHQALPHGASPNRAAFPRLAQYLTLYPADQEIHPDWR